MTRAGTWGALSIWLVGCSALFASNLDAARTDDPDHVDGAVDGGVDEAADAGDADVPPDASSGRLSRLGCAALDPPPKVCRDFDDGQPFDRDWDEISRDFSTLALDPVAWSGTQSLKITMRDAPGCSYGRVLRRFFDTGAKERVDVRVRIRPTNGPFSNDGSASVLVVHLDTPSPEVGTDADLIFVREANGFHVNVQQGDTDDVRSIDGVMPFDRWSDLQLTVTSAALGPTLKVAIVDEEGRETVTTHVFSQMPPLGGDLGIFVGFHCENGNAEVRYDDLVVDWR